MVYIPFIVLWAAVAFILLAGSIISDPREFWTKRTGFQWKHIGLIFTILIFWPISYPLIIFGFILSVFWEMFCEESLPKWKECFKEEEEDLVEDGFGGSCYRECPECHEPSMIVVRPGKFTCSNEMCDNN